jgi:hypothetical protein
MLTLWFFSLFVKVTIIYCVFKPNLSSLILSFTCPWSNLGLKHGAFDKLDCLLFHQDRSLLVLWTTKDYPHFLACEAVTIRGIKSFGVDFNHEFSCSSRFDVKCFYSSGLVNEWNTCNRYYTVKNHIVLLPWLVNNKIFMLYLYTQLHLCKWSPNRKEFIEEIINAEVRDMSVHIFPLVFFGIDVLDMFWIRD